MNQEIEEMILRQTLDLGLLCPEQLQAVATAMPLHAVETWGPRLQVLIERGWLDVTKVNELCHSFSSTEKLFSPQTIETLTYSETMPVEEAETVGLEETQSETRDGSYLQTGMVLARRFQIIRFIAQGGMGQVYEAEDLELGGTLALKTLRPEIAKDAIAIKRFHREIRSARQVTHPNVCRVYDVFRHQPETVTDSELIF